MTTPKPQRPLGARGVRIAGTGMAVPPKVLTNEDLAKIVDTNDEWITQRTGIKTRHVVEDRRSHTSELGAAATREALTAANISPADLDLLICATMTPDVVCPASACKIVHKIGAIPCGAFDINIACTGLIAALNLGHNYIASGFARHVAVVAAETLSSIVDWEDRRTCILFGDAASAIILSETDDPGRGSLYQNLGSDGQRGEALFVPRDENDIPPGQDEVFSGKYNTLQMNGKAVYKFAVNVLAESVENALAATGLTVADVKMVIPHQSNIRMLQSAWKRLGFDGDKVYINIDRFGNTSAASVGICLHELLEQKRIGEGDHVIFVAQGGGLSWGTNLWRV
jgi:3-oxoacyl-[acyl-carrier-protein] synthase-3